MLLARVAIALLCALIIAATVAFIAQRPLTIFVSPRVIMAGHAIHIMCRILPDHDNRWLELGIVDYRNSGVQLDGEMAPITHEFIIDNVPCEVGIAYCRVSRSLQKPLGAMAPFTVANCEQ